MTIPLILRPSPFAPGIVEYTAMPGETIETILRAIPGLRPEVWTHGVVRVGDWEIPRDRWHLVRPKAGSRQMIHVGVRLGDRGGGGGGKNPFVIIAAIALVVVAAAITGGALGPAGFASISSTLFAAGSTSAALAAAGVSVVGSLALNALSPVPAVESSDRGEAMQLGSASSRGNALGMFSPIPFVVGTHRVAPPHIIAPWSEAVNDDQFVNVIYALNGAHLLENILINEAPIEEFSDIEYEVRDVVNDDTDITVIDKQVFENSLSMELSSHKLDEGTGVELQDAVTPANSYPKWHVARSRSAPDEIWLGFFLTGLFFNDAGSAVGVMPLRMSIRRLGTSTWINLPEFWIARERQEPFRATLKLRFQADPGGLTRVDQDDLPPWGYALYVTNANNAEGFDVNSYFTAVVANNAVHVGSEDGTAVVYLDPAIFAPDVYDIRVMRGQAGRGADIDVAAYKRDMAAGNDLMYLFTHVPASSPPSIRFDQAKAGAKISWQSMATVWNDYPLGEKGLSLIAVRAKNTAINSLTVLATGYANTWDGADWDTFEPTSNPAAWWRYLALGGQSIRAPFIEAQLDDAGLADWFDFCVDQGLECNAFIEGRQSLGQILQIVAANGRAAGRISDKVGVVIERDRTADGPIQLFSQRNSRGLAIRRAFPRIPHGFRVRFNDAENDYKTAETFIYRQGFDAGTATEIEAITYVGITDAVAARVRGQLDFDQLQTRGALYNLEADIENLYCTKGSLVALSHDTVSRHHDAARVVSVQTSGGNVTGLTLDVPLRLSLITELGGSFPAGVVIQLKDGTTIAAQINQTGDAAVITFTTPFAIPAASALEAECLVACGPFSSEFKRMLVLGIQAQSDYTAALTLIDEAPEINQRVFSPEGDAVFSPSGDYVFAPA